MFYMVLMFLMRYIKSPLQFASDIGFSLGIFMSNRGLIYEKAMQKLNVLFFLESKIYLLFSMYDFKGNSQSMFTLCTKNTKFNLKKIQMTSFDIRERIYYTQRMLDGNDLI